MRVLIPIIGAAIAVACQPQQFDAPAPTSPAVAKALATAESRTPLYYELWVDPVTGCHWFGPGRYTSGISAIPRYDGKGGIVGCAP